MPTAMISGMVFRPVGWFRTRRKTPEKIPRAFSPGKIFLNTHGKEKTLNNAEAWNNPLDRARQEALEQLCAALDLPKPDDAQLERMADFFNEAGMLRHTPRSGYAFLGSGAENVAEHSFRTAVMGYALARMADADAARTTLICLFHDLHEARTGDFNYVNHRYNSCRAKEALDDAVNGTGLERDMDGFWTEWTESRTPEAALAHDADQLDLIFNLKAELDKGNAFALEWLESAVRRLTTPQARLVAAAALRADHNRWWYGRVEKSWWVNRK